LRLGTVSKNSVNCFLSRKHFINQQALDEHKRSKIHKKRVKDTQEVPYTIEESERAGGLGSYVAPIKKVPKEPMDAEPISV